MSRDRIYLDHNASAPLRPEAQAALVDALRGLPGNASSVHAEGRAAHAAIETAREAVAALVGGAARNVVFTSGGTEAANLVLAPALARGDGRSRDGAGPRDRLILGATEHACCLAGHRFAPQRVRPLPVDGRGVADLGALAALLAQERAPLVAVQAANNETGVLQPLAAVVALARAHGNALVVADAVQAAGRVPIDLAALGLDAVFLSAHKLGGPKGVGALVLAEGVALGDGLVRGGGQEGGRRGGTQNVAGIVGFGAAARQAGTDIAAEAVRLAGLRDRIEAVLRARAPGLAVFGAGAPRLPNTLAFARPGLSAETALMRLDIAGIAVSSGAACSSGRVGRSSVLAAMGVPAALAAGAIRVSLGWTTTEADVECFLAACEGLLDSPYPVQAVAA